MRSSAVLAGFFAVSALATPLGVVERKEAADPCDDNAPPCLTYEQAQTVADHFKELIAAYSDAKADEYLTVDFTDYSDSVSELINSGCTGPAVVSTDRSNDGHTVATFSANILTSSESQPSPIAHPSRWAKVLNPPFPSRS